MHVVSLGDCLGHPSNQKEKVLGLNYIISLIKPNLIFTIKKNSKNIPMKFVNKIFNITKELKNLTQRPNRFLNINKENQISCILFTSGTTGPPKGVIVSQKMLLVSAYATGLASDVKKNDKFLLWESLHHIGGIEVILLSLLHDIQIVLLKNFLQQILEPNKRQQNYKNSLSRRNLRYFIKTS